MNNSMRFDISYLIYSKSCDFHKQRTKSKLYELMIKSLFLKQNFLDKNVELETVNKIIRDIAQSLGHMTYGLKYE